jgi:dihydropyrimidinase
MHDLGIVNGFVYQNNEFIKTNVYINNGIITLITPTLFECKKLYDCKNNLVLPGVIDPHTHFELDLGGTTSLDGFCTGTKAAAYGGVTSIIDFLDPVDNEADLEKAFAKRKKQALKSNVNYKFHACLKNPKGHIKELIRTCTNLGLDTIKIFTTYSDSGRRTYEHEIKELLLLTKENNITLTVHVENDDLITLNDTYTYKDLLQSRPTISETSEALKLASFVEETHGRMYMVHLSSGDTLELLKEKYPHLINKDFIIESCPHYFIFDDSVLHKEEGYLYTMAPPLRSKDEKNKLRKLIDDVFVIGTDHCTFNILDKQQLTLKDTPLGIGGVEYSFQLMYSLFGDKIIDKMTKNVAIAHHLYPQKGIIKEGSDADMFVYKLQHTVLTENHSAQDHNIYKDLPVNGEVLSTIVAGNFVVEDRVFIKQHGILLNKKVNA